MGTVSDPCRRRSRIEKPRKPLPSARTSDSPKFPRPALPPGSDSVMDSFRINKFLGLVLGTALFLQTIHIVDAMFIPGKVAKPSPEAGTEKEEQPSAGGAQSFESLLASAS